MARPRRYFTEEERIAARNASERARRLKDPQKFKSAKQKWTDKNPEYAKQWYEQNRTSRLEYNRKWSELNKEKKAETRRRWYLKIKENGDINYFKRNIRSLIYCSFKRCKGNFRKNSKTEHILGCTITELLQYLVKDFKNPITIKDFGSRGYHIDHIVPLATARTEEDIVKLCHYTNLQALWYSDNLKKSDKILINE